ncbi:unnamed protein product [Phytophthora lilii]|uniref:Unnamed protein product n=1 Tax=Phytophthora lilii TaxID=2077276 RepID=A0A9W6WNM5_9STRA|nr:unnamed protein product [Phytophthora lilii]
MASCSTLMKQWTTRVVRAWATISQDFAGLNGCREGEAQEYSRMDVASRLRNARRSETKPSSTSSAGGHNFLANGAKAIASFFRPRSGTSVLEADDNPSVIRDHGGSTRGRTLNLSCESNEVSSADYGEEKAPIQIDDKPDCGSDAMKGGEGVVVIQTAELGESDSKTASTDTFVSSPLQQEEKTSEILENRKRAASSRREDEKLKQREIESRRNEVLLTYPYDGSDTAGRISVTLGDIDRLVPGEFLNDNIIDFYLRFLWRHLESWQQQQMYFFTSHFFTQLNGTNGAHELTTTDPDERFARVARWTQKETNLFNKQFLFIPINDSFHWSIAVFCNPGSAIIKIRRNIKRRRRVICKSENDVVDLVNGDGDAGEVSTEAIAREDTSVEEEVEEEEVQSCQEDRLAHPPCLLFLDSLRCHRKKKFTKMLRNYLECEWRARFAPSADDNALKTRSSVGADEVEEEETIVTSFDSESISLIEPNVSTDSEHACYNSVRQLLI